MPLVVKGILSPEDARLAVEAGVAGIVVSTHGGRQLDRAISTADALPGIVEAVGGRCAVWVDGGIRRGLDVVTASRSERTGCSSGDRSTGRSPRRPRWRRPRGRDPEGRAGAGPAAPRLLIDRRGQRGLLAGG